MINLNYHDIYWESDKYGIPRMDPDAFLKAVYAAMKPGAVDRRHRPCRQSQRATRARRSRSSTGSTPNVVKARFQARRLRAGRQQRHAAQPGRRSQPAGLRPEDPRQDRPLHLQVQEAALSADGRAAAADESREQLSRLLGPGRARPRARRSASSRSARPAVARRGARPSRSFVGTLWLNALKMTVIPLVVALLVVGIAKSAEAAQAGTDRRPVGAVDRHHLHRLGGVRRGDDPAADARCSRCRERPRQALQAALAGVEQTATGPLPGRRRLLQGRDPAQCRSPPRATATSCRWSSSRCCSRSRWRASRAAARRAVVDLFEAIADALLVIIGWVLVGRAARRARAGLHRRRRGRRRGLRRARPLYRCSSRSIGILVTLAAYPLAVIAGRHRPPASFTRGDDRAAGGRDLDPLVAGLASGDAGGGAGDGHSRARSPTSRCRSPSPCSGRPARR